MCGIFGYVDLERLQAGAAFAPAELEAAARARDGMVHRGPDGAGLWHTPGVLFGHRRLAILDLSPAGHQPMLAADGTALTFNGEIYNYVELRAELARAGHSFASTSDTEVLLTGLRAWGLPETLARLRGMYAFAAWDPRARRLDLARDPVGKKPLYVWRQGPRLAFASALLPLVDWLRHLGVALSVDPVAVEHHLAAGYIPAPRTVFCEIAKLEAGAALSFDAGGTVALPPRPIPFARAPRRLDAATLADLDALLQQAVTRRLRSDVPVATFLSGGLDSSLVTALAARAHPGITAYTVRTPDRNQDEFAIACKVARTTGVRHEVLDVDLQHLDRLPELVRLYGEPFGDSSALPTYLIAEQAGRHHRVILTGDGGDEVQGGYPSSQLFAARHLLHRQLRLPDLSRLPAPVRDALGDDGTGRGGRLRDLQFRFARLFGAERSAATAQRDDLHALHDLFAPEVRPLLQRDGWRATLGQRFAALPAGDELDRWLGLDFSLYLPEDLCVKVDVAAMAHAVETRAPLLDLDFVDACWQVRAFDRVRPWQSKRIVRALLRRHLPADCVLGRKQGFSIPVGRWLDRPEVVRDVTQAYAAGLPGLDFLDGTALAGLLRQRRAIGQDNGVLLWRLLVLQQWARLVAQAPARALAA